MARLPIPFCGWRGRRFYFKTPTISIKLEGARQAVEAELRKCLPAWLKVAELSSHHAELAILIRREIDALPPQEDANE